MDIQSRVYTYRAMREDRYPGIDAIQSAYFDIMEGDRAGRKAYREAHPELVEYWDWRKQFAASYPKASPWILSEDSLASAILGEKAPAQTSLLTDEAMYANFSQSLMTSLMIAYASGAQPGGGALDQLRLIWERLGQPRGNFDEWVTQDVKTKFE